MFSYFKKENILYTMLTVFQVDSSLRKTQFTNPVGDIVNMNQKGELQEEYDIFYIWNFPQGLGLRIKIGMFSPYFPNGQQVHLSEVMIRWAKGSTQVGSA
jgi:vomeronasal 2 receptor